MTTPTPGGGWAVDTSKGLGGLGRDSTAITPHIDPDALHWRVFHEVADLEAANRDDDAVVFLALGSRLIDGPAVVVLRDVVTDLAGAGRGHIDMHTCIRRLLEDDLVVVDAIVAAGDRPAMVFSLGAAVGGAR